ncbi:DUF1330 domain-containing protein [Streptomyces mirabilis]
MTAYLVAEVVTHDPILAQEYKTIARQAVAEFGGRYLVVNDPPEVLEGRTDDEARLVILAFENAERARAFYHSDTYAPALEVASRSMSRRIVVVEGPA